MVKHCVENLTNHVLRYRKLLMDDKSEMMKYHTGSHDGIISFILNGRGKSVHVQHDKVFVCDTDSKRKKAKYTSQRASQKKNRLWLAWETNHTKRNPQNHESPHHPPPADYMSDNHESIQELLQYRIAFTCQIDNRSRFKPKVQFAGNYLVSKFFGLNKLCKPQIGRVSCPAEWVFLSPSHTRRMCSTGTFLNC